MDVLVVVDMQKDFISGALGTKEAVAIVPRVAKKIAQAKKAGKTVVFTRDTHHENYLQTQEGKNLPVPHCIKGTPGWMLQDEIAAALEQKQCTLVEKVTFGSVMLPRLLYQAAQGQPFTLELVGLCTDICVVSNALMLKANFPEMPICVDSACCAGVTPETHRTALETMRCCQIEVI